MTRTDACSEAEWMLDAIVDDFAQTLDLPDRARFYARLVELLNERYDRVQRALDGDDRTQDSLRKLH